MILFSLECGGWWWSGVVFGRHLIFVDALLQRWVTVDHVDRDDRVRLFVGEGKT